MEGGARPSRLRWPEWLTRSYNLVQFLTSVKFLNLLTFQEHISQNHGKNIKSIFSIQHNVCGINLKNLNWNKNVLSRFIIKVMICTLVYVKWCNIKFITLHYISWVSLQLLWNGLDLQLTYNIACYYFIVCKLL